MPWIVGKMAQNNTVRLFSSGHGVAHEERCEVEMETFTST